MVKHGQIFSADTQAVFYNWKQKPIQRMLDFDYLCGRSTPSVACIVQPGSSGGFQKLFFGSEEIAIPVYGSTPAAIKAHRAADVFINFASFRSAYESSMEALQQPSIRVIAVIAEGVPEGDTKQLIAYAAKHNKIVLGPATVGGLQAGAFRIGDTAGTLENIVACKLYRPGSVGFVSKSGGMSNEMYNVLSRATNGLYEGIAIGGDVFPGSTLSDHCLRYQNIPDIKLIVVLGELGGHDEYSLVDALKSGKINKPVVAWDKNAALKAAGAIVPESFEGFEGIIKTTYDQLVEEGQIQPQPEYEVRAVPQDLEAAKKAGKVRVPTTIVSSICDDRGEEPTYNKVTMSTLITGDYNVGDVISLLWFKRQLPKYATRFIELVVMLCADHGPGLLTIGPRFGGAVDDSARYFQDACDRGLEPDEFVEDMKKKGIRVPGIGHRIKSKDNRDKRVELLQKYAFKFFPSTKYLNYAVQVETYTLQKAANLVLNVDGCIGTLFLDLLHSSSFFTEAEIADIVKIGYLNGLFVLARSIGLIGHALDQKRLQQPLYRHPWDEVLYI
ncbi:MAG: ATP-citrate lyase B-1 [Trebouxia sp. A1-2]|nr:MAG: ATP-citrate lyase B-1 [Trebouxia sp. A1-2]